MSRLLAAIAVGFLCACGGEDATLPADGSSILSTDARPSGASAACPPACDASPRNAPPEAMLSYDSSARVGREVVIDGSQTRDPDGDAVRYLWLWVERPEGSAATLADPYAATARFTADRPGDYTLIFAVSDGIHAGFPLTITVTAGNSPPYASITTDVEPRTHRTLRLRSGAADADDDPITHRWRLIARPERSVAALSDTTVAEPTLHLDVPGTYGVQVTVSDGLAESSTETYLEVENHFPIARLGPDRAVAPGAAIALDGSASSDEDGDALEYRWTVVQRPSGSAAVLAGGGATPTLQPDVPGTYRFSLVVHDGTVASAPATLAATVVAREQRLPVTVADATYSRALGVAVVILKGPSPAVQIINIDDGATRTVPLAAAPTALALSSDGRTAAIGQTDGLTLLDVAAARVVVRHPLPSRVGELILGPTHAFAVLPDEYELRLAAIDRATGAISGSSEYVQGLVFGPGEATFYTYNGRVIRVSADPSLTVLYELPHGRGSTPLFASEDRARFFGGSSRVFDGGADVASDMLYAGELEGAGEVRFVDHSAAAGRVATVIGGYDPGPEVLLHDDRYHALVERLRLPPIVDAGGAHASFVKRAFFTADGRRLVVFCVDDDRDPIRFNLAVLPLGGAP